MSTFKERMEYVLGWYTDKEALITVGEDKKTQGYATHLEYLKKYFSYVRVIQNPNNVLGCFNEASKPQFIFFEDKFFGSYVPMLEKAKQTLSYYEKEKPCILFLCSGSIQFIGKSIKTKIPELKKSALFIRPLRSVTLHAYLMAYIHHTLEKEQKGKASEPISYWMKHYESAMVSDNPVKLDGLVELVKKEK